MSNEIIEIIKTISVCFGCATAILTVLTAIVTPLRRKIIGWVRNTNNTNDTIEKLNKIEEMLESHISLDTEKWDSITSIQKLNLIDLYKEYHNLGGDTYCTDRYKLALHLPEKNI